jgi:hypothetical protein
VIGHTSSAQVETAKSAQSSALLVELPRHVVAGVDADLLERLDDLWVRSIAGVAASRAGLVTVASELAQEPFGHQRPACVGDADEQHVHRRSPLASSR